MAAAASATAIDPRRAPGKAGADTPTAGGMVEVVAPAVGNGFGRAGPVLAVVRRGLEAAAASAAEREPPPDAPTPCLALLPIVGPFPPLAVK